MDSNNIKTVKLNESKIIFQKPKKKRMLTQTNDWNKAIIELEKISNIEQYIEEQKEENLNKIILKQIKSKISSYASQDKEKKLYNPEKFIKVNHIIELFKSCNLKCYYCKEKTEIMYENVREPKQWTLERLNNNFGHNCDNVVIACLNCNLKRRCIDSERYIKTKEMSKVVKLN